MDNATNKVETSVTPYTTITMIYYNRGNCMSATVELRTNDKGDYDFEEFIKFTRTSGLEIKTSTYCKHNRLLVYTLQRWN